MDINISWGDNKPNTVTRTSFSALHPYPSSVFGSQHDYEIAAAADFEDSNGRHLTTDCGSYTFNLSGDGVGMISKSTGEAIPYK